ncbi:MAG: DUF2490 domain-containing protein [Pseudomonadota bacterium]
MKGLPAPSLRRFLLIVASVFLYPASALAQLDESQVGAWYALVWNTRFDDSRWGLQGDVQHRNFDLAGDLQQVLLRAGLTYAAPGIPGTLTLGIASVNTGEFGPGSDKTRENRIYQQWSLPGRQLGRWRIGQRFRFEQRWFQGQDLRTRLRYSLSASLPLNHSELRPGTYYLSLANELFLNGERDIGGGRRVDYYDRYRIGAGLGYSATDGTRLELGYMRQITDNVSKGQLMVTIRRRF